MAGTFIVQKFVQEYDLTNRLQAYMAPQARLAHFLLVKMVYASQVETQRAGKDAKLKQDLLSDGHSHKWLLTELGVRNTMPSVCVVRKCVLEPP